MIETNDDLVVWRSRALDIKTFERRRVEGGARPPITGDFFCADDSNGAVTGGTEYSTMYMMYGEGKLGE